MSDIEPMIFMAMLKISIVVPSFWNSLPALSAFGPTADMARKYVKIRLTTARTPKPLMTSPILNVFMMIIAKLSNSIVVPRLLNIFPALSALSPLRAIVPKSKNTAVTPPTTNAAFPRSVMDKVPMILRATESINILEANLLMSFPTLSMFSCPKYESLSN
jgi:hypothetical protein